MAARTARAAETRKKKNDRRIARPKQSRIQGNTGGVRSKLRKQALLKAGRAEA
ncbi:MAG: hypothetical protein KJ587_16935 [Alphaproteobacteria bacterium]|nr:hypothetical protein [Alphaproteobacteria bacterium]